MFVNSPWIEYYCSKYRRLTYKERSINALTTGVRIVGLWIIPFAVLATCAVSVGYLVLKFTAGLAAAVVCLMFLTHAICAALGKY